MVEFAFAISILLALVFGIIEFAWVLHGHITLTGAVREGARIAVVGDHSGNDEATVKSEAKDAVIKHARIFNLLPGDIEVTPGIYGENTVVEVEEAELPLLIGIIPSITLRNYSASMMHE